MVGRAAPERQMRAPLLLRIVREPPGDAPVRVKTNG